MVARESLLKKQTGFLKPLELRAAIERVDNLKQPIISAEQYMFVYFVDNIKWNTSLYKCCFPT